MKVNRFTSLVGAIFFLMLSSLSFAETKTVEIPFYETWLNSPHGDFKSEAFTHWNEEDIVAVPKACASCHSTTGHLDFLGADGSNPGIVDTDAPVEEGVACVACHNKSVSQLASISFPSGLEVEREESDARCMDCHQGRASGNDVKAMISKAVVTDDVQHKDIKFINVHYSAAAATRFGSEAAGGFEYDNESYMDFFYHDDFATQCNDCHSPHSTKVKVSVCTECHEGVSSVDDFAFIRSIDGDFDGDGSSSEGIKQEIEGLEQILYTAMKTYSAEVVGTPIVYDTHAYPYFFNDTNANGAIDEGEAIFPNAYKQWTPRLAKAAYNYQFVLKDAGGYVHNPYYVLQLLNDSVQDLGQAVKVPATSRPE